MKLNRSLAVSTKINDFKLADILGALAQAFPSHILEKNFDRAVKTRKRIFTHGNTLLTMVISAAQADKTLKNAVNLYSKLHQQHRKQVREQCANELARQKAAAQVEKPKMGRLQKYTLKLPISLEKDISLNTAAYAKARQRLPLELVEELFKASRIQAARNEYSHWHGYRVMITDGTYLQLQDTAPIRAHYRRDDCSSNKAEEATYPQALLAGIIERGTGQIYNYRLSNRYVSELSLLHQMLDELPAKSILLADDLYDCYEILAKCKRKGIELVVPGKRVRDYRLVSQLGPGDELVEVLSPSKRSKWLCDHEKADKLLLRRMVLYSPTGKPWILYSTLLDKQLSKAAFAILCLTRWDIEVSIREMKTIMDIGVIRSQSVEMVHKEVLVGIATYNMLRKLIHASIQGLPFSPQEDFFYKFYTFGKAIFVDAYRQRSEHYSLYARRVVSAY